MPDVLANGPLLGATRLHVDDTGGDGRPVVLMVLAGPPPALAEDDLAAA